MKHFRQTPARFALCLAVMLGTNQAGDVMGGARVERDGAAAQQPHHKHKPRKAARKPAPLPRGSSTPPGILAGPDNRASQRAVCQSQCNLERQSCDQGRNAFRDRADQLQAAQASCYLAVQGCLSRC